MAGIQKIDGTPSVIPKEVIGAHGGFPLSEWQKYLNNPDEPLLFRGQDYTRKVRYLTNEEKRPGVLSCSGWWLVVNFSNTERQNMGIRINCSHCRSVSVKKSRAVYEQGTSNTRSVSYTGWFSNRGSGGSRRHGKSTRQQWGNWKELRLSLHSSCLPGWLFLYQKPHC